MNAKHMVSGVALLGVIAAGLAGTGESARAGIVSPPSVTLATITASPLSVKVMGTDFTPGGRVHIDLVERLPPYGEPGDPVPPGAPDVQPHVVASVDTMASRARNVPNGHGVVFHLPGGYFTTTLTAPPRTDCATNALIYVWTVATDEETGTVYTTEWTPTFCG